MKIGGWQKVSLVDYPGKICTILFTQGCNFRCPYCHNPELVIPSLFRDGLAEASLFAFLEKRKGVIDAVTVTGGEPTLQPDLAALIRRIKELGYLVKLDTNGSQPNILNQLIEQRLLDYIAMDIKGPLNRYAEIVRAPMAFEDILKSVEIILGSGVLYEFRTTVVESLLANEDFKQIGNLVENARLYILQQFIPSKTLDPAFLKASAPSEAYLTAVKASLEKDIQRVEIR